MVNSKKVKGSKWEADLVQILNKNLNGVFKRVPGSGAMGTSLNEGLLTGDVVGKMENISKTFRIECKVGYGGATQFTLKKEWLDKIKKEADSTYSYPFLAGKFSGALTGVKQFIVLDIDTFLEIIELLDKSREAK